MDEVLNDFLIEAGETLAELDIALLTLEHAPEERQTLSQVFRLVHTIKGTCGFLALPRLERVAHGGENVLAQVRDSGLAVTPKIVSLLMAVLDRMRSILAIIATAGTEPDGDDAELIAHLEAMAACQKKRMSVSASAPATTAPDSVPLTIRVPVDRLEALTALTNELVLTRNQLLQLDRERGENSLTAPLARLSQITSELQEGVLKTRKQPIEEIWAKLPRLVRDLAVELGKRIELVRIGGSIELDRHVLEQVRDPLIHMVRNSADHGIEPAAERRACGKSEIGRITLRAQQENGHIRIEIEDDGRGLSNARIHTRAVATGIATEVELATMSERQVHQLIFHPGFSTATAITAVSGRGVGMDVVQTNIEQIGGTIDFVSVQDRGTRFTLRIPLAIATMRVVEAGGERVASPQHSRT